MFTVSERQISVTVLYQSFLKNSRQFRNFKTMQVDGNVNFIAIGKSYLLYILLVFDLSAVNYTA